MPLIWRDCSYDLIYKCKYKCNTTALKWRLVCLSGGFFVTMVATKTNNFNNLHKNLHKNISCQVRIWLHIHNIILICMIEKSNALYATVTSSLALSPLTSNPTVAENMAASLSGIAKALSRLSPSLLRPSRVYQVFRVNVLLSPCVRSLAVRLERVTLTSVDHCGCSGIDVASFYFIYLQLV